MQPLQLPPYRGIPRLRPSGKPRYISLRSATEIRIRRYTKIRAKANPFDTEWDSYFDQRLGYKMHQSLTGRKRLLKLWWNQDKQCPLCHLKITTESSWETRRIVSRLEGGKDGVRNLILVHSNCYK